MDSKWFDGYITENTAGIEWSSEHSRASVGELLTEIAEANGGDSFTDIDLENKDLVNHAIQRTDDAISRRMALYAKNVREQLPQFLFSAPQSKPTAELTTPHRWQEKLNLNTATFEELEPLPAIGDVLAARILSYRLQHGAFHSIKQLKDIKGIDDGILNEIAERIVVIPRQFQKQFLSIELLQLAAKPNLKSYVALLLTGGGFSASLDPSIGAAGKLVAELKSIRNEIQQNPFSSHRYRNQTRSTKIKGLIDLQNRASQLGSDAIKDDNAMAGLIFDAHYFDFTQALLRKANTSIKVIMFYMRYDNRGENLPNDLLVEELIAAKKRGVDVQVILDRDHPDSILKSRLINDNAFKALKAADIDVFFEETNRATHTKLVIVDGAEVVLGSHNWTSGSLQRYDDTSVYLASKPVGQHYVKDFEARLSALKSIPV